MKILIVTLEYPPQIGGVASYVKNLALHLEPTETFVWAPEIKNNTEYDQQFLFEIFRGQPYFKFFWPRWLRLYFQVKKICKSKKIDCLFIHHALPGGYVGYLIKKTLKIPYKIFLHGSDVEIALKRKKNKFTKILKEAKQIIVNSNFLKNKLLDKISNLKNLVIVYPPVGNHFFIKIDENKKNELKNQLALEEKKVILSVSRLAEGKGFSQLLRVLQILVKNIPNVVLLIIGDGSKRNKVISLVQKYGLQNNVRYLGEIENNLLPIYYQISDLFVLLTHRDKDTEEGWGTVFLEAAASGLSVVAGKVGGVEEAVEHLKTGILIDNLKDEEVVEILMNLLKNKDLSKQMGILGKKRVSDNFTWQKQLPLILN